MYRPAVINAQPKRIAGGERKEDDERRDGKKNYEKKYRANPPQQYYSFARDLPSQKRLAWCRRRSGREAVKRLKTKRKKGKESETEEKSLRKEKKRPDSRSRHEPLRCRFLLVLIQISIHLSLYSILYLLLFGLWTLWTLSLSVPPYANEPLHTAWVSSILSVSVYLLLSSYLHLSISPRWSQSPTPPNSLHHYHTTATATATTNHDRRQPPPRSLFFFYRLFRIEDSRKPPNIWRLERVLFENCTALSDIDADFRGCFLGLRPDAKSGPVVRSVFPPRQARSRSSPKTDAL